MKEFCSLYFWVVLNYMWLSYGRIIVFKVVLNVLFEVFILVLRVEFYSFEFLFKNVFFLG